MPFDEPLPDTWHDRDLPVLRAAVAHFDRPVRSPLPREALVDATGLTDDQVTSALHALERADLVVLMAGRLAGPSHLANVAGDALELTGQWPTPETGADRMIAALEQIAENGDTQDERSGARKVLDGFGNAGRQVAISVAGAVITGGLT